MEEFTQSQAAMISGYDERAFRGLLDKRIILASPETRNTGRGKAKTFLRHEVRVAAVLKQLDLGLSTFQQAGIADWLRQHVSRFLHDKNAYAVLEFSTSGDQWQGDIRHAGDDQLLSVMIGSGEDARPMRRFIAVHLGQALWWDEDEKLELIFEEPQDQ